MDISGSSTTNMTAPVDSSAGGIPSVLFFQDPANTRQATISGGSSGNFQGALYFPTAQMLTFSGGSSTNPQDVILDAWKINDQRRQLVSGCPWSGTRRRTTDHDQPGFTNRGAVPDRKDERSQTLAFGTGQSAVELAIVVPVLLLLLVVIADFARVFFVSVAVNNAARAGAQFGSQSVTNAANSAGMVAAASADAANISNWNTPTASQCTCIVANPQTVPLCATSYCTHAPTATYVTVNTSATYNTILNYPGITSSYTLTGKR